MEMRNHLMENAMRKMIREHYHKILYIDLTQDSFEAMTVGDYEWQKKINEDNSNRISDWFRWFAESPLCYDDDRSRFLAFTSLERLRSVFREAPDQSIQITYQRKFDVSEEDFSIVNMELIPVMNEENGHQMAFLFVKNVTLEPAYREQTAHLNSIRELNRKISEQNESLKTQMNVTSALSNAYFICYTADFRQGTMQAIKENVFSHELLKNITSIKEAIDAYIPAGVSEENIPEMRSFMDDTTIVERLANTDVISMEFHGTHKEYEWCRASWIVASRDESGQAVSALYAVEEISEDVKERMRIQRELQAAHDAALEASKAKTSFLFNMSHDIRTPMNAILGFSKLMKKELTDPKLLHYQEKIDEASEYLLSLINNVLDMARIESGRMEVNNEPAPLGGLSAEIFGVYETAAKEKGLKFTYHKDVKTKCIYSDHIKIKEIYSNLLSNAIKYTPAGGSVSVELRDFPGDRDGYVNIQAVFEDTGIGMSKEFLSHLFEEFSRDKNTTESKIAGTGLGMAIVKRLVDLLGGTIQVESEIGKGTKITLIIPHQVVDEAYFHTEEKSQEKPTTQLNAFDGRKILLAEDNDLNAEIAVELLQEYGFVVERVEDGVLCVDQMTHQPAGTYDLILMDIQMPNMNGYDATRMIRQMRDPEKANIPIVAMTANAFEEDKREAYQAGMNGHLAKPIDMAELIKALSEILGSDIKSPFP